MPQMAPYNWLILFILFNLIMLFIITYKHSSLMKSNYTTPKLNKKIENFKWMW